MDITLRDAGEQAAAVAGAEYAAEASAASIAFAALMEQELGGYGAPPGYD